MAYSVNLEPLYSQILKVADEEIQQGLKIIYAKAKRDAEREVEQLLANITVGAKNRIKLYTHENLKDMKHETSVIITVRPEDK